MKNSLRSLAGRLAVAGLTLGLASSGFAATFASTTDASAWTVSTAVLNGAGDGQFASFDALHPAAAVTRSDAPAWISNVASGTNGYMTDWTFFVFQQSFTLSAAEAATFDLKFQWAADDSGEGFAYRGAWTPKYSLNGGALVDGSWPSSNTYSFGNVTDVSGFHEGVNTLTFYVEGNGVTDGMALNTVSFTSAVPEPGSLGMLAAGLGLMGAMVRRAKRQG